MTKSIVEIDEYADRVFTTLVFNDNISVHLSHTEKHPILDHNVVSQNGVIYI